MKTTEKLITTVSTKGQVILPKALRRQRHWEAGTKLVVENTSNGVLLNAAPVFAATKPMDVFGSLAHAGKPKTLEEMQAGIVAEVRRRQAGNRYDPISR